MDRGAGTNTLRPGEASLPSVRNSACGANPSTAGLR
jgi:hypothetical protein